MAEYVLNRNIFVQNTLIDKNYRAECYGHEGKVIWFTGLSGSGKSTLAYRLEDELFCFGVKTFVLDGDNLRKGLCSDLTFSSDGRKENIRRAGEVAKLFLNSGIVVLASFITPYQDQRSWLRNLIGKENFIEIYCKCSLQVCEQRDVKGLYKKVRAGKIKEFTGISSDYEEPDDSDIIINTDKLSIEDSLLKIMNFLEKNKFWRG